MNENIIEIEEETIETSTAVSPANTSRRLIMAGIGIIVTVGSEASTLANRVIEQSQREENQQPLQASQRKLQRGLQKSVGKLFRRMNIPTKSEIDTLNTQIAHLLNKVEALQEQSLSSPQNTKNLAENTENITMNEPE